MITPCPTEIVRPLSAADPTPRGFPVQIDLPSGPTVEVRVDEYSDRLRCDHPGVADGESLGAALKAQAEATDSGRVVVLARASIAPGLEAVDFEHEALIPGFYEGREDCAVLGYSVDEARADLGHPIEVARVDALIRDDRAPGRPRPDIETRRATVEDAPQLAELIDDTFDQYPTPSGVPDYLARAIDEGVPFRFVRRGGEVVACASADLVREARTAELTDCATRPEHRGQGLMQAVLTDLMDDLREMNYPTAFTLARARIPGVNLAFQRLGFGFRGRMVRSCRIGGGLEDMNVWSRRLAT